MSFLDAGHATSHDWFPFWHLRLPFPFPPRPNSFASAILTLDICLQVSHESKSALSSSVGLSVAIFCYAGIGHVLGRTPDDKAYKSLTVYGEVLQKIQSDYVDEPNMHLVTAGSLHGLLESLDAESSYLTPREYTEYKQKQQNAGTGETGLTLSKRFGYVIVISVLPDSPAEKAGIHSGDIFESVAGFTTRDMSVGQALNLLNGQVGQRRKSRRHPPRQSRSG